VDWRHEDQEIYDMIEASFHFPSQSTALSPGLEGGVEEV